MITTHSIITYHEPIGSFMFNYMLNFAIETLVIFWLPCLFFFSLIVIGLFRPKRHLLSLRRCVILLGSVCALWGLHFASGVLFIFIRIEPEHYDDCMIWGIGIGYMIRGCILLLLASIIVCQNLLFVKRQQGSPFNIDKEVTEIEGNDGAKISKIVAEQVPGWEYSSGRGGHEKDNSGERPDAGGAEPVTARSGRSEIRGP